MAGISVKKLDDASLATLWAIVCRVMLEQPQSPEFDALFIRETTAIEHHTYRFAKKDKWTLHWRERRIN